MVNKLHTGVLATGMLRFTSLNMFEVLLRHIIAEQALVAMFDNVVKNFSVHKITGNVGDTVTCTFIDNTTFRYFSSAIIKELHADAITLSYNQFSVDMLTGNGTLYVDFVKIKYSDIQHIKVI